MIRKLVRYADAMVNHLYLRTLSEKPSLIILLFHTVYRDDDDQDNDLLYPLISMKVSQFRQFLEHFLEIGYTLISPDDLAKGLASDRRYLLLTFDDGYYNNTLALPVLQEFKAPALFFISSNHIDQSKGFWWDAYYRECVKRGASLLEIDQGIESLKTQRHDHIERHLIERFGTHVLASEGDRDRPFTPSELRDFAREPYVHIGNHTTDHAILTNYTDDQVIEQIGNAQKSIQRLTGVTPNVISYPNGNCSPTITRIAQQMGLSFGISTEPRKNHPTDLDRMKLGRFMPLAHRLIPIQCEAFRTGFSLSYSITRALSRLKS